MRIAFISDPHGDLVALNRVITDLGATEPVDDVLVGGDLAQVGDNPAEVVDTIRGRGWSCVRGNGDDLLIRVADGSSAQEEISEAHGGKVPKPVASRAVWSVAQLGVERIDYLRTLPIAIERGPFSFGTVVLVTPWSTEQVVLADADVEVAGRMLRESRARVLVYGHIHTPYQRRVGYAVLMSVGAVHGSNDADPRPAYTIVTLGATIEAEVRRVETPVEERPKPGPFPIRSQPGVVVRLWP